VDVVTDPRPSSVGLELTAGPLRLALRPDLGAAIAGLWCGGLPVLHSAEPAALTTPRPSGGFVLAPYSNRLGDRRFHWQGQDHTTAPNTAGSPHSLHGLAWARPWAVVSVGADQAELLLAHAPDADWPFAFTLRQRLLLTPNALKIALAFTNTDTRSQPVGLGWYPFFHRRAGSHLQIDLSHRWDSDPLTLLPATKRPQPGIDADVAQLAFDHCFEGWRGAALIHDEALSLRLSASLPYLVVFTPARQPYFCVEPVGHVNNAIQMADPAAHGLCDLAAGATLEASFLLEIALA
jgi:aldose 1-epimerase